MSKIAKFPGSITMGYTKIDLVLMDSNLAKNIGEQQGSYIG